MNLKGTIELSVSIEKVQRVLSDLAGTGVVSRATITVHYDLTGLTPKGRKEVAEEMRKLKLSGIDFKETVEESDKK